MCLANRKGPILGLMSSIGPYLLQTLALQCENYRGEKLLCCQQKLGQLGQLQKGWLNTSLQLFRRHPSPSGETPEGQQAVEELDGLLSEFLKRLDTQVTGENGEGFSLFARGPSRDVYAELVTAATNCGHFVIRDPRTDDIAARVDGVLDVPTRCRRWSARYNVHL